jgi:hypothetical protein
MIMQEKSGSIRLGWKGTASLHHVDHRMDHHLNGRSLVWRVPLSRGLLSIQLWFHGNG